MHNRQTSSSRNGSQHREERSSRSGSRTDRARSTRPKEARAGSERSSNRSGGRSESGRGRGFRDRDVRGARTERQVRDEARGDKSARAEHEVRGEGRERESARAARSYSEGRNRTGRSSGDSSSRRGGSAREREVYVGSGNRGFSPRRGQGLNSSWMADRAASSSLPLATLAPVLCIVAVVLIAILLVTSIGSCVSSADNSSQSDGSQADQMEISYTPSIQAIDGVSDPGTNVQGISLADSNASYVPQLSEEGATQVRDAVSAITANNKAVGFVFIDLQTGSGYVYNLDQRVYGASSFKGHVLIYGCQQALETGQTSISRVNSSAQDAIMNSDNTSYYRMRSVFESSASESLSAWLSSMNISSTLANDTSFPHYSARESLKLWMNTFLYLNSSDSNKEITEWAKKMLSGTTVSMVRNGVDPNSNPVSREKAESVTQELLGALCPGKKTVEVGEAKKTKASSADESVTVYDKAGWINGSSDDAVCDAGIIEEEGKYYLITIMTNLADGETSRAEVSNLAAALWDQRSTLAPEQGYKPV